MRADTEPECAPVPHPGPAGWWRSAATSGRVGDRKEKITKAKALQHAGEPGLLEQPTEWWLPISLIGTPTLLA